MLEVERYRKETEAFRELLRGVPEELTAVRPAPEAWCLREIVGHLVDSASNNHQRFVRLQLGSLSEFPAYEGEHWVEIQRFREMSWPVLVQLWSSYNELLLHVVERIDPGALKNCWSTGGRDLSLQWLVEDYYRHLQGHARQFEERLAEVKAQGAG